MVSSRALLEFHSFWLLMSQTMHIIIGLSYDKCVNSMPFFIDISHMQMIIVTNTWGNSMRKVCMSMLKDEIVPVLCDFLSVTELESLRHEHC